jgi:hypothetical protein
MATLRWRAYQPGSGLLVHRKSRRSDRRRTSNPERLVEQSKKANLFAKKNMHYLDELLTKAAGELGKRRVQLAISSLLYYIYRFTEALDVCH